MSRTTFVVSSLIDFANNLFKWRVWESFPIEAPHQFQLELSPDLHLSFTIYSLLNFAFLCNKLSAPSNICVSYLFNTPRHRTIAGATFSIYLDGFLTRHTHLSQTCRQNARPNLMVIVTRARSHPIKLSRGATSRNPNKYPKPRNLEFNAHEQKRTHLSRHKFDAAGWLKITTRLARPLIILCGRQVKEAKRTNEGSRQCHFYGCATFPFDALTMCDCCRDENKRQAGAFAREVGDTLLDAKFFSLGLSINIKQLPVRLWGVKECEQERLRQPKDTRAS